ncbi:MAG: SRPBCC domain-containing protein [Acidobacteriota bacterium]|nr:SRPBCC domain-containing protein [Acidobacteriota bacterium]
MRQHNHSFTRTSPKIGSVIGALALCALQGSRFAAAAPTGTPGLARDGESIHQEVIIDAPPSQVYEALTNAKQYDSVEKLGIAMQTILKSSTAPTVLSPEVGTTFVLFGGHVVGRNLELVPNLRIVQAWREMSWQPGVYSIVKFELSHDPRGTKISFDHAGFPKGGGAGLTQGWYGNYWEPLEKYLTR